jgi:hypothetical protein
MVTLIAEVSILLLAGAGVSFDVLNAELYDFQVL